MIDDAHVLPVTPGVTFDAQVDLLVVGAGGCGLVCALAAASRTAGLEVAIVEKLDRLRGNSVLSSGSIPAAGTRLQREAGVEDSPAAFIEDLERVAGRHEAPELTRALAEVSAELVDWLVGGVGIDLTLVKNYKHIGHRVHRLHSPPSRRGADLMQALHAKVEKLGIPVAFGNRATDLLVSGSGAVVGVVVKTESGETSRIAARSVVLATNGFGASRRLLERFCPDVSAAPYGGATGSEGEAIEWGLALNADFANMSSYQAHASLADPHGSLVTWTVVEKGGFIVDGSGRRIGNESAGYSDFAALELQRPGPYFVIADVRVRDATASGQTEYAELVEHGGVLEAADPTALANRLGIDPEAFSQTIAQTAAAARGQTPDAFGRVDWGFGALSAPYTSTRIAPALFHTQGGLKVDTCGRVMKGGEPIPGLFAGGGAAAGISGNMGGKGYMSGNGLLGALGLGYLAGRAAADALRQ